MNWLNVIAWPINAVAGAVVGVLVSDQMTGAPPRLVYSVEKANSPITHLASMKVKVENLSDKPADVQLSTNSAGKIISGTSAKITKETDARGAQVYTVSRVDPDIPAIIFFEDPAASFTFSSTTGEVFPAATNRYVNWWSVFWHDRHSRAALSGAGVALVLLILFLLFKPKNKRSSGIEGIVK